MIMHSALCVTVLHLKNCAMQTMQKSLDFHGPPLPMALVMDAKRIKIIFLRPVPYIQHVHK
jgi:hypothetical protein